MTLALFEMSSELVHGRSQYAWMAPKPTLVGVFGQPGGPSIELARVAKTLRDSFKQGRAWASEPLPAIAAPTTEAPIRHPSRDAQARHPLWARRLEVGPAANGGAADPGLGAWTPKSDIRSALGASTSAPPTPPDEYDGDAGGPHSLDEVIFD